MKRLVGPLAITLVLILGANVALAARTLRANVRPAWANDKVLTILVIGSDAGLPRPGDPRRGRSDAIHLIAVDTRKNRATVVDIPRDSYIGGTKVNAHLVFGGPDRLKSVMSNFVGFKIDYYALTSFRGLRLMTDSMGGIRIRLDQAIRDSASKANLGAGRQKLNGYEAVQFSRARKTVPGGDFGRTRHQGELLRAAHRQYRSRQSDLMTTTKLIASFARNTATDIPVSQMYRLASLAKSIKPKDIKQVSLSGSTRSGSDINLFVGDAFSDIRRGRIGR